MSTNSQIAVDNCEFQKEHKGGSLCYMKSWWQYQAGLHTDLCMIVHPQSRGQHVFTGISHFIFEILIGRVDHYTLSRAVVEAESCFTCECSVHAVMHLLTSLRGQRLRGLNLSSNTKDWYIKEHYSTPLHLNEAQIRWRVNNGDFVSCLKEN